MAELVCGPGWVVNEDGVSGTLGGFGMLVLVAVLELGTSMVTPFVPSGETVEAETAGVVLSTRLVVGNGGALDSLWGKSGAIPGTVGLVSTGCVAHEVVIIDPPDKAVSVGTDALTSVPGRVSFKTVISIWLAETVRAGLLVLVSGPELLCVDVTICDTPGETVGVAEPRAARSGAKEAVLSCLSGKAQVGSTEPACVLEVVASEAVLPGVSGEMVVVGMGNLVSVPGLELTESVVSNSECGNLEVVLEMGILAPAG